MAQGWFEKVVGSAERHPVVRVVSLVSTGVFVVGVVIAIVRGLSDLGWGYVAVIAVPLAVFAMCVVFLAYDANKPAPALAADPPPPPVRLEFPAGSRLSLVVDDPHCWIGHFHDRPGSYEPRAECQVHVTNQLDEPVRLVKARLVGQNKWGDLLTNDRRWDYIHLNPEDHAVVLCRFRPSLDVVDGDYTDTLEITDQENRTYALPVTLRSTDHYAYAPTGGYGFDEEPF